MQIRFLFIILIALSLTACGSKGPVRPLTAAAPGTVQAPELRQQGDALLLGWQLPTTKQDGSQLEQPPVVDVYRMSYDPNDDCPECRDRSTLLASINPELPTPAQQVGNRYLLQDRPLQPGSGYQYKLITRNAGAEQSRPLILRQIYVTPLPAPQQLTVTPHDRSLSLQWRAPVLTAQDELLGYLVYRRIDSEERFRLRNPQPLTEPSFQEFSLENATRYHYRVRALVKRGDQDIESLPSATVSALPQAGI